MRIRIGLGLIVLATGSAWPVWSAEQDAPSLDRWSRGGGNSAYNHVHVDCSGLMHSFGRNGSWGRWSAPLDTVRLSVRAQEEGATPQIFVECLTQGGCITQASTGTMTAFHYVEFGGQRASEDMVAEIEALKGQCAARP